MTILCVNILSSNRTCNPKPQPINKCMRPSKKTSYQLLSYTGLFLDIYVIRYWSINTYIHTIYTLTCGICFDTGKMRGEG